MTNVFVVGEPTACPECSNDAARTALEEVDEAGLNIQLPHPLEQQPSTCTALLSKQSVADFTNKLRDLLTAHTNWLEQLPLWKRPIFKPSSFACFVVLNQKTASARSFNPQHFAQNSPVGYGLEVYQWNRSRLKAAAANVKKGQSLKMLLGYGLTCRTFVVNNSKLPNKKQRDKWVNDKKSSGFDSVQLSNGNVVFWDPYCLYATHQVELNDAQINSVLHSMDDNSQLSLAPEFISFSKPETPNISTTATRNITTATAEDFHRAVQVLEGTPGEDCRGISTRWDAHSFGAVDQFAADEQKEFETKLSFSQHVFHTKASTVGLFAGVSCLQEHIQASPQQPELKLLLCLELLHHNNTAEADEALQEYIDAIQTSDFEAHPLLLLAIARLLGPGHVKYSECLEAFRSLHNVPSWLTKDESSHLSDAPESSSISAPLASPSSMWEELKRKENCTSKAMDELLGLTGLTQVKRSALGMFKTALNIAKMTPEARKLALGTFCLNYVFLGNPGTGKTTVARLFAQILKDSKIRAQGTFVECTAQEVKDNGTDEFRKLVAKAVDGVLFIDEAYDLDPKGDFKGNDYDNN